MTFEWAYLHLNKEGRLVYKDGVDANVNWPAFDSPEEAQEYLENKDVRADCVGIYHAAEEARTPEQTPDLA